MAENINYSLQRHEVNKNLVNDADLFKVKPEWQDNITPLNAANMIYNQESLCDYSKYLGTILMKDYIGAINKEHDNTALELRTNYQKRLGELLPRDDGSGTITLNELKLDLDTVIDGSDNTDGTCKLIIKGLATPNNDNNDYCAANVKYVDDKSEVIRDDLQCYIDDNIDEVKNIHTRINTRISIVLDLINQVLEDLDTDDFWSNTRKTSSAYCLTNGYEDESIGETVHEVEPLMITNEDGTTEPLNISLDEEDQ